MWTTLGIAASVGPAVFAWVSGRRLVRLADDPALPERLAAYRSRLTQVVFVAGVLAGLAVPGRVPWLVGLMLALLAAAGFPMRKALFRESWGLPAYLVHVARMAVAWGGFWLLLAAAPLLVLAAGAYELPAAALVGTLLLAWQLLYPRLFLWVMRATPLDRPDLTPRFDAVLARATARAPRVFRAGPAGGVWASALAFPGHPDSQVLVTDTVLSRFDPDELTAIFAHEVAHLEHYDRRRIFRAAAIVGAAVLVAVRLPWLAGAWAPTAASLWPVAVFLGLCVYLTQHKRHEAESDRRAVALCGDAEALVRALVKLHVLVGLPRRWEVDFERAASHPSLAHRIQAIREAGGEARPAPVGATVVRSRTPGTLVVLDTDRVHRLETVPSGLADAPDAAADTLRGAARAVQTIAYSELTDLRVRTTLRGTPALVATDRAGRSWAVPLAADAVAPAQRALDAVDGQLARAPLGLVHLPALGVVLAAATGFTALYATADWIVAAVALVALVRPAPAPLAAVGAGGLMTAALALREHTATLPLGPGGVAALALVGAVTLAVAVARVRGGDARPGPAVVTIGLLLAVVLAGGAALVWAVVEAGLLGLAQAARNVPLAGIALAALAAALAVLPPRWARPAGIAVLILALGHAALGSHWFVDRAARDPLLAGATEIPRGETSLRLVHEARFGREWSGVLVLAASGSGYALAAHGEDHPGFHLGGSGPARFVTGDELSFLGDGRMLVLTHQKGGAELRLVDAAAPETAVWQHTLPGVIASDLAAEPATGAWRLTAEGARDGYLAVVTGVAGQEAVSESRWPLPPGGRSALAVGTDSALAVTFDWRPPSDAWPAILPVATMAVRYRTEMHLWLLGTTRARRLAATRLSVRCVALPTATTPFACLAWDGARTHLWSVDAHGRRTPIGTLPGGGGRWPSAAEDRIVLLQDGTAWLVDPGRRLAERLHLPGSPVQVVYRGGRVGAVSRGPDGVTLRLYTLN